MFGAGAKQDAVGTDAAVDMNRSRYLQLLTGALLNEIYLENEVRFLYIFSSLAAGKAVDTDIVRQIAARLPQWVEVARAARQDGRNWFSIPIEKDGATENVDLRNVCQFSHTMVGRKRLENVLQCL